MESRRVACVIPTFNADAFVAEAIESVLVQTYAETQIIVVDDGSTDCTEDVVRPFGRKITYLPQPHRGAAAAKNAGIRASRSGFVAFLDADDLWHPDKLTRQMALFEKQPGMDLLYTDYKNFWARGLEEEEKEYQDHPLSEATSGWSISTLLAKRSVFRRFGFFEVNVTERHQSLMWALRAAKGGATVQVLHDVLMYRRLHQGNQSRGWTVDAEFLELVKAWKDYRQTRAEKDAE